MRRGTWKGTLERRDNVKQFRAFALFAFAKRNAFAGQKCGPQKQWNVDELPVIGEIAKQIYFVRDVQGSSAGGKLGDAAARHSRM